MVDPRIYKLNESLFCAIHEGNPEKVSAALTDGADPNAVMRVDDSNGETSDSLPLYEAVIVALDEKHVTKKPRQVLGARIQAPKQIDMEKMKKVIRLLLEKGADMCKISLCTVISINCGDEKRHADMIRFLIASGASVYEEYWGKTFLLEVLKQFGHKGLFEFILNNGADLEHEYESGIRLLHNLCEHMSADEGTFEGNAVRFVLDKKIDVNARAARDTTVGIAKGDTPLIVLAKDKYRSADFAKLLVQYGADINLKNAEGRSALTCAIYDGQNSDIRDYLRSLGAKEE